MATVVLQNDAAYFPRKGEFIPERWIKGDPLFDDCKINGNNSFVYLPFGFGPRSCIGRRFAEMEIFIMLGRCVVNQYHLTTIFSSLRLCFIFPRRIVREFNIEYNYGPLKYKTSIILSPDEDLKFKFTDIEK